MRHVLLPSPLIGAYHSMRKLIIRLGVFIAVALAVLVILIVWVSRKGSSLPEQLLQSPLKAIINAHLNGELKFDNVDDEAPGTVRLGNVLLVSGTTDIITARRITLMLSEIPSKGQPIRVKAMFTLMPPYMASSQWKAAAAQGENASFATLT